MASEPPFDKTAPSSIRRIGAYRFLAVVTLPTLVLLCLACADIVYNLVDIEKLATVTNKEHLPGILASQRTLINIESMRRNVETAYASADPNLRREAGINALALAAESVFEPDSSFAGYAATAQPLIRRLITAKNRSDKAGDDLHNNELRFSAVLARLQLRSGLPADLGTAHGARHLSTPADVERDTARYQQSLTALEPVNALCREVEAAPAQREALAEDCRLFRQSWGRLETSWKEHVAADMEARTLWKQLDDLLRTLSDAASSTEADLTYRAMEHISSEAQRAQTAFYVSSLLLLCILLTFVIAIHRYILAPIALASRDLRKIRYGIPTGSIPPVRIRELQDLLDLLPSLSQHLADLSARSGKLEREKDRYANLSLLDALTGVHNRRSFDQQLAEEGRTTPLAVLMLDVDMFKLYNDALGHQAGDAALVAVAQAMEKALLRSSDRVFRYGGEEFTVLLPNAPEEAALAVAARILESIRHLGIPHPSSPVAPVLTVSIGVSVRDPEDDLSDAQLVDRADKALYQAKSTGRNRVCLYRPEIGPPERPGQDQAGRGLPPALAR